MSGVRKNRSHSWEKTEPPGLRTPTTGTSLLVKHVDILKTSWESSIGKLFLHWWPEPLLCRPLYDPLPPAWTLSLQRLSGVKKNIKKYTDQSQTVTPRRLHLGEQEVEPAHRITSPLSSREATPSLFPHLQIWPKLWCPGSSGSQGSKTPGRQAGPSVLIASGNQQLGRSIQLDPTVSVFTPFGIENRVLKNQPASAFIDIQEKQNRHLLNIPA